MSIHTREITSAATAGMEGAEPVGRAVLALIKALYVRRQPQ